MKKILSLLLTLSLVFGVTGVFAYSDVEEGTLVSEAVTVLSDMNIINGFEDGTFRPTDNITRAEVAKIVCLALGNDITSSNISPFNDVPATHWAAGYIDFVKNQKIVNGYGDGNFGPEDNINFEDVVKMIIEALGYNPFVVDNGGYYAGHILAAQRYGILTGVSGKAGEIATREQVVQMFYNAIDTPLMERSTYGSEEEYTIYNGKNNKDYISLLTRDLNMYKVVGVIKNTSATNGSFDEKLTVDFDWNSVPTDVYYNYSLDKVENSTIYANGFDCDKFVGKEVVAYLEVAKRNGEYNIISIAETNGNKTLEIGFEDVSFDNSDFTKIEYYKNETDRNTTIAKIDSNAIYYYNNVDISDKDKSPITNIDATDSGKVILINNDSDSDYDIVKYEKAISRIVDIVSNRKTVTFKVGSRIDFDTENTNVIIKLTKNGKEIDYTDLNEWDVLSVLVSADKTYYDIEVIADGAIDGIISASANSDSSADGNKYQINGRLYDVAKDAYKTSGLKVGMSGTFYIDKYGKIVAYDKNGASSAAADNYAYIIDIAEEEDTWAKPSVLVRMLTKDNEIIDTYIAENFVLNDNREKLEEVDYGSKLAVLKNQLVLYDLNSSKEIKEIQEATNIDDDYEFYFAVGGENAQYDEDDYTLRINNRSYDVDEDTVVFFISNASANVYDNGNYNTATTTNSKVATMKSLTDGQPYDYAKVYDNQDGVAGAVVVYNTTGGISNASNIALIESVGEAYYNDDTTTSITYWMNGEKKTAYLDEDYNSAETFAEGDIWKFAIEDEIIFEGEEIYDVTEDKIVNNKVISYYGPAIEYLSSRKAVRVGTKDSYDTIKVENDTNVYVYDTTLKNKKITVGDLSDINIDKEVVELKDTEKIYNTKGEEILPADVMDYVFAIEYDGDIIDVVIFKSDVVDYDIK